jgi:hypothetical protein
MSAPAALATTNEIVQSAIDQVATEEKLFALAQRKAQVYSQSSLVPKEYQGNVGNVLIAENMARRMGADTLMVMQNLYVVHGKPGWSAVFLISCFNTCGRFSAIKYRFEGQPQTPEWGCVAYCTETATGDVIEGTKVTWGMANAEGWVSKSGSKWKTMPEQMFRYRAATFLIRSTAPEIGMGLLTKEELEDVGRSNDVAIAPAAPGISGMKGRLGIAAGNETAEPDAIDVEVLSEQKTVSELSTLEHVLALRTDLEKTYGVSADDLNELLPEGVKLFKKLTEEQAADVLPSLEALLDAKQANGPTG